MESIEPKRGPKQAVWKQVVIWWVFVGLADFLISIVQGGYYPWLANDGAFSLIRLILEIAATVMLWPVAFAYSINRLGFTADGQYNSVKTLAEAVLAGAALWYFVFVRKQRANEPPEPQANA